jgi:hypothetical protein
MCNAELQKKKKKPRNFEMIKNLCHGPRLKTLSLAPGKCAQFKKQ